MNLHTVGAVPHAADRPGGSVHPGISWVPPFGVMSFTGLAAKQAAAKAAEETTPATVAELGAVQQQVQKLKSPLHAATGKLTF